MPPRSQTKECCPSFRERYKPEAEFLGRPLHSESHNSLSLPRTETLITRRVMRQLIRDKTVTPKVVPNLFYKRAFMKHHRIAEKGSSRKLSPQFPANGILGNSICATTHS